MYWKNNLVKCDIVVGKGKKSYDKRQILKKGIEEKSSKDIKIFLKINNIV